jgi:protein O-mannosyl-transferase
VSFTVLIYRKLENPIAFIEDPLLWAASNAYVHFKYFTLLVLPLQMSADWSFDCIPMITSLSDPRIIACVLLYGSTALVFAIATVRYLRALRYRAQSGASGVPRSASTTASTLLFVLCLTIFPFVPASNWLFPVGTLIGERLLYLPSLGYCILLAWLLSIIYHCGDSKCTGSADQTQQSHTLSFGAMMRKVAVLLVVLALIGCYSHLTYERNFAWDSEETLFLSAASVCPESAKVQEVCLVHLQSSTTTTCDR